MDATGAPAFDELAAKVSELAQVCARLSQENTSLRREVSRMSAGTTTAAESAASPSAVGDRLELPTAGPTRPLTGKVSRRMMGRAVGAAAVTAMGAAALVEAGAQPAAAATAAPDANGNSVTAGNVTTGESRTSVLYDGPANFQGVVLLGNDSTYSGSGANFPAGLGGWAGAGQRPTVAASLTGSTATLTMAPATEWSATTAIGWPAPGPACWAWPSGPVPRPCGAPTAPGRRSPGPATAPRAVPRPSSGSCRAPHRAASPRRCGARTTAPAGSASGSGAPRPARAGGYTRPALAASQSKLTAAPARVSMPMGAPVWPLRGPRWACQQVAQWLFRLPARGARVRRSTRPTTPARWPRSRRSTRAPTRAFTRRARGGEASSAATWPRSSSRPDPARATLRAAAAVTCTRTRTAACGSARRAVRRRPGTRSPSQSRDVTCQPGRVGRSHRHVDENDHRIDPSTNTHLGAATDATFSPDGTAVAVAGVNGSTALLDVASATAAVTLYDPRSQGDVTISAAAYSPDGRLLAVAGGTLGKTFIWSISRVTNS